MISLCVTLTRDQILTSNQRLHWAVKARRTSYIRGYTRTAAMAAAARTPIDGRARIDAVFQYPDKRRRDRYNLWPTIKAAVDGIVAAGILEDDSDDHIDGPFITIDPEPTRDPRGLVRVVITIRQADTQAA